MKFTSAFKATLLASAVSLAAIGAAEAQTLRIGNGGEPGSIDPHQAEGDWENRIIGDYLEGLMTEDADGEAIPGQAESYEVSDDGLVYTFTLRDDIFWTDGEPVTAGDFEFAFQRLFNPETAASYAYLQYPILNSEAVASGEITDMSELGVEAIDDRTLQITLANPTPYFIQALTHYTAFPVPQHAVEEFGADWTNIGNVVGNGPFMLEEWIPGSYIRSVKNPDHYAADEIAIEEVIYNNTEDTVAAFNAYLAGELDILTAFPPDQYEFLETNRPGEAHVEPFLGIYYYVINQEVEPFNDVRIREALSISVNREVIGPDILTTGEIPAYGWVPPGTANYDVEPYMPDWASEDYGSRVERAVALMDEAGYGPDNPLSIQLRYNTNEAHQRIAVALAAMWEPLGVTVELFNAEVAVHYDALDAGDFQIGRAGWLLDYSDAANTLDLLRTGTNQGGTINWGNNYGRYSNEEFDALLAEAATEQDLAARADLLREAEGIAMDEFAAIPIYWYVSKNAVATYVEGFVDNPSDIHRTRWISLTNQ